MIDDGGSCSGMATMAAAAAAAAARVRQQQRVIANGEGKVEGALGSLLAKDRFLAGLVQGYFVSIGSGLSSNGLARPDKTTVSQSHLVQ